MLTILAREWEDRLVITGCLSAGIEDEASGQVDIFDGVKLLFDCPQPAVACTAAMHTKAKAKESSSDPASVQVMVVLNADASVLLLHDTVALCWDCLNPASKVVRCCSSLKEAGIGAGSVVRLRAQMLGGIQPAGGGGGDFGQWT